MPFSLFGGTGRQRHAHFLARGSPRSLAVERLEERLPLRGSGFEVETPYITGNEVAVDGDAMSTLREWLVPRVEFAEGADGLMAVPTGTGTATSSISVVGRDDDAGNSLLTGLIQVTGLLLPTGGLRDGDKVASAEFVVNTEPDPHKSNPKDERVELEVISRGTVVAGDDFRYQLVLSDGAAVSPETFGIEVAAGIDIVDSVWILTIEFAGAPFVPREFLDLAPDSPLTEGTGPFALGGAFAAYVTDYDPAGVAGPEERSVIGAVYRFNIDGDAGVQADEVPLDHVGDLDMWGNPAAGRFRVAVLGNPDFSVIFINKTRLQALDENGKPIREVQYEILDVKYRDLNGDGIVDAIFNLEPSVGVVGAGQDGLSLIVSIEADSLEGVKFYYLEAWQSS